MTRVVRDRRKADRTSMIYCLDKPQGCGQLWRASLVGVDGRCYLCHQKDKQDVERRLLERLREELAHGAQADVPEEGE